MSWPHSLLHSSASPPLCTSKTEYFYFTYSLLFPPSEHLLKVISRGRSCLIPKPLISRCPYCSMIAQSPPSCRLPYYLSNKHLHTCDPSHCLFYLLACAIVITVYFIFPWLHNKFPSNTHLSQARQVPINVYLIN